MYGVVLLFVKIATAAEAAAVAAAALVCLFVCHVVCVIDLFIAALVACLRGWLIRSARHGTAWRTTTTVTATTRPACLRVFGGACWAALADVRLGGARRTCVRV